MSDPIAQHTIIQQMLAMAQDLGRTPTRSEFVAVYGFGYQSQFGIWSEACKAAGLDPIMKAKKIDNSVFQVSLGEHLESYEPEPSIHRKPYPELAVISDIHWPFHKQQVIDRFYEYVGDMKPKVVAINGDARDMYSHSKFPRSHNVFTPEEESNVSQGLNANFWVEIKKRVPEARCIQTLGNHCVRPLKRMLESYPESEKWVIEGLKREFTFPGVETIFDAREEVYLSDDIILFHGYRTQLGSHRDFTFYSCVNGHSHVGGVVWKQVRGTSIFELNSGYAGDPFSKGLTYTPQKITQWTHGFGAINKYGPQFVSV